MAAKIVCIFGYAEAGKSASSQYLRQQFGFKVLKFADPLKDMLRAIGLTTDDIEGDAKKEPNDLLLGKTPRHAMQTLGTEWGRIHIGEHFWSNLWASRLLDRNLVTNDDMRFPNEAEVALANGAVLIKVTRPSINGGDEFRRHESEQYIEKLPYHFEVINNGSIGTLFKRIHAAASTPQHELPPLTVPESDIAHRFR